MSEMEHDFETRKEEFKALICLSSFFPKMYRNLKKHSPYDLVDENQNMVEVTQYVSDDIKAEINDFKKQKPKEKLIYRREDAVITRVKNEKGNESIVFGFTFDDYRSFLQPFKKKLEKLQKRYSEYKEIKYYDLYIIDRYAIGFDNGEVEKLINCMVSLQKHLSFKYRYVYIEEKTRLLKINLSTKRYKSHNYPEGFWGFLQEQSETMALNYPNSLTEK